MPYIDLTRTFKGVMPVYPGDPLPQLHQISAIEKQGFTDHQLKTGMHAGTHMDAPQHLIATGKKISDFPSQKFFGRGILIDARGKTSADADLLAGVDIRPGDIVLVMFGWSQKYRKPDYFKKYPELTKAFAQKLANLKVSIVGMDTPSPDYAPYLVHKLLLKKEILIIENLCNLELLIKYINFEVIALPMKLKTNAAPCRVVARV